MKIYSQFSLLLLLLLFLFDSGIRTSSCWANARLDRQYRLESLGLLRSTDNVDHILSDYLEATYQNFFEQQSRFQAISSKAVDQVLRNSKISDQKLLNDSDILTQIARVTQVETLLRTHVTQVGQVYQFKLDWLHAPQTEVLGSVHFELEVPHRGRSFDQSQYREAIQKHLTLLISQVPFQGQITGRDQRQVTLNLGEQDHLHSGDILTISTLEEVKKHPLLQQISEWRLVNTGKIKVTQVERSMSFGTILEEEPGKQISKHQKIVFVPNFSLDSSPQLAYNSDQIPYALKTHSPSDPEIGWGAFSLPLGSYERSFSSQTPARSFLGHRFTYGARMEGNLFLNREFFSLIRLSYQLWNHQQSNPSSGQLSPASLNGGVPGTQTSGLFSLGYQIPLTQRSTGPQGWVSLGYKVTSITLPISTSEGTSPSTFKSLLLGAGVHFHIKGSWTLQTALRYRIFTSVDAQNLIGQASTQETSDVEFYLGALFKINEQFALRGGLEIQSLSAGFDNGTSLSQKTMTFAPALLYYF